MSSTLALRPATRDGSPTAHRGEVTGISTIDLERTMHLPAEQAASALGVHVKSLYRARGRVRVAPDYGFALRLLEEGAPYPEAARTIGVTAQRVRRRFPGFNASDEHRAIMVSIRNDPKLCRLYGELMSPEPGA